MPKFMKKPLAIEAWQVPNREITFDLVAGEKAPKFVLTMFKRGKMEWREQNKFQIETISGVAHGRTGDYLVQSAINPDDVYPINRAEFEATYEAYDERTSGNTGQQRPESKDAAHASRGSGDNASGLQSDSRQSGVGDKVKDGSPTGSVSGASATRK